MNTLTDRNVQRLGADWKRVEVTPQPDAWATIAAGAAVPLGTALAAAVTSYLARSERVAMAAWIATGVVGTAAVISAATAARHRTKERHHERDRSRDRSRERNAE